MRSPFAILYPALVLLLLIGPDAQAKRFRNQFISFELPANWTCAAEGADWTCQSADPVHSKDSIIVFAAKLRGDEDTLEEYMRYLQTPRSLSGTGLSDVRTSKVRYSKYIKINGQDWIDALHEDSELPGFYTRYCATVHKDIAVLVTWSVNKKKYEEQMNQFDALAKSIKVFRPALKPKR